MATLQGYGVAQAPGGGRLRDGGSGGGGDPRGRGEPPSRAHRPGAGAKEVIARVHGLEFTGDVGILRDFLGVDLVINPGCWWQKMSHIARSYGALDVMRLAEDQVELVELERSPRAACSTRPWPSWSASDTCPEVLVMAVISDGKLRVLRRLGRAAARRFGPAHRTAGSDAGRGPLRGHRAARRICILGGGVVGQLPLENLRGHEVEVTLIGAAWSARTSQRSSSGRRHARRRDPDGLPGGDPGGRR